MQPGQFNPKGEDWIGRELAELRRELRELKAANVFGLTGITPKDGGTDFDGYVNVNGPMTITGALNLPAGIIGNDALANPSYPYAGHSDSNTFALATGENAEKLALSIPAPDGFTRAHVFAAVTMQAYNSNASRDEMYVECRIGGVGPGFSSEASAPANSIGFCASNAAAVLTGLSGPFSVSAVASSGVFAWPADIRNVLNLNVFVTFLR